MRTLPLIVGLVLVTSLACGGGACPEQTAASKTWGTFSETLAANPQPHDAHPVDTGVPVSTGDPALNSLFVAAAIGEGNWALAGRLLKNFDLTDWDEQSKRLFREATTEMSSARRACNPELVSDTGP